MTAGAWCEPGGKLVVARACLRRRAGEGERDQAAWGDKHSHTRQKVKCEHFHLDSNSSQPALLLAPKERGD